MVKQFVDRGDPLQGISNTVRDSRLPYNLLRKMENFALPDGRARRRPGFSEVDDWVEDQWLCKATGTAILRKESATGTNKQTIYKTPLSYAVLPYHSDYDFTAGADWTREFYFRLGDLEELVLDPFVRYIKKTGGTYAYGGTTGAPTEDGWQIRREGVYLLDQSVLANRCTIDTGTIAAPGRRITLTADHSGSDQNFDSIPLTAMAIGFDSTKLWVEMGVIGIAGGDQGVYFPREILLEHVIPSYATGDELHVAVRWTTGSLLLELVVDGVVSDNYTLSSNTNYGFVGQYDQINNVTYASGLGRDIVLLNECTARASYASTCRTQDFMHGHQTFYHAYDWNDANVPAMPWCCSPPRGTAMRDFRQWSVARDDSTITTNMNTTLSGAPTNCVFNFPLNDGSGVCIDTVNNRKITLHHGVPSYQKDALLLHSLGLNINDGQHLILSTRDGFHRYVSDVHTSLKTLFEFDPKPVPSNGDPDFYRIREEHGFTVQVQIKTPFAYQQELDLVESGGTYQPETFADSEGNETRQSLQGGASFNNNMGLYRLTDGSVGRRFLKTHSGEAPTLFPRGWDSTLFSIEGTRVDDDDSSEGEQERAPLARGLLTPEGKVAFEVYLGCGLEGVEPRIFRTVSSTALTVNTVYVITFVKRPIYDLDRSPTTPTGMEFEIWLQTAGGSPSLDVSHHRQIVSESIAAIGTGATPTVALAGLHGYSNGTVFPVSISGSGTTPSLDGSHLGTVINGTSFTVPQAVTVGSALSGTVVIEHTLRSTAMESQLDLDVIIGASNVQSGFDKCVSAPNEGATDFGPWLVPKHFMTSRQDLNGRFSLGYFRMWTSAQTVGHIEAVGFNSITSKDYSADLLFNLELEAISGSKIQNKCRYPVAFNMGYKGWGVPQGFQLQATEFIGSTAYTNLIEPLIPGSAAFEDGLGYMHLDGDNRGSVYSSGASPKCNTLASFETTLSQAFGLLLGFRDSLAIDKDIDGSFDDVFVKNSGLLSDFSVNQRWFGTSIGDRTILTSPGGLPKVYNGRDCLVAGFKRYQGGKPVVVVTALGPPRSSFGNGLTGDRWYGVRIVYESEEYNIRQITDVALVRIQGSSPRAISLLSIPPHPDPRVTSIRVYRTRAQVTKDFARNADLYPVFEGAKPNSYIPEFYISQDDSTLINVPLNRNQTELPVCSYGAAVNGRLYLAGDVNIPDAVYFSAPGNPEKFDTVRDVMILEEASGDKITGLLGIFGQIIVFKPNSIWVIEEVAAGQHQVRRVADVGAVSDQSIVVATLPDTGRTVVFFWSHHGPYMFDLATLQYVGYGIEEKGNPGAIQAEYDWLEPTSVVGVHDRKNKEIIFCYKTNSSGDVHDTVDEALALNYRSRSLYRYTGMVCERALSQTFTGGNQEGDIVPENTATQTYKVFMGSSNGRLYAWAEASTDGLPANDSVVQHLITGFSGSTITCGGSTFANPDYYKGLWAMVYNVASGAYFICPIASNTATQIVLNPDGIHQIDFSPDIGADFLYVCQPAARLTFPWDNLEVPFRDKQIIDLLTWHNQDFIYQLARNWDETDVVAAWQTLSTPDVANGRRRTTINASLEAVKLDLVSLALGATLDAYAYEVDYREDAIPAQG